MPRPKPNGSSTSRTWQAKSLVGRPKKAWFTGHNTNIDRDDKPRHLIYTGGTIRYRQRLAEQADEAYPSFRKQRVPDPERATA